MKATLILLILGLIRSFPLPAQVFLNLDFEYPVYGQTIPQKWYLAGEGYEQALDSTIRHFGQFSLRMGREEAGPDAFGVCGGNFPVDLARGKSIAYRGWIRTEKVAGGFAGLWWRVDGKEGILGFDNMGDRGLSGDSGWTEVAIEMAVDSAATNINFGALLVGSGTAWFDRLEIWVDGEPYLEPLPRVSAPTAEELEWLRTNVIPLRTVDPDGSSDADLAPLKKLLADARVVGLGEVTHGSSEIFRMKHRLVRFLREQLDFDLFSIEANMPEAYRLDDYVLKGEGDPVDLIRGMYFWTWRTEEVLAMVEWMRAHNGEGKDAIRFTGFDMQYYAGSLEELSHLSSPPPTAALDTLRSRLDWLNENSRWRRGNFGLTDEQAGQFAQLLSEQRAWIEGHISEPSERAWALQNVRLLEQYLDHTSFNKRDVYMAENLTWIAERHPGSKIALWAHNGHIQESDGRMGQYLAETFGDAYLTIGFAFHEGAYTAIGKEGLSAYEAQASYPGTYEYFFQAIDEPIFLLDLRAVSREDPASKWIFENLPFRQTGAMNIPNEFIEAALYDDFDLILFVRESSASSLLPDE